MFVVYSCWPADGSEFTLLIKNKVIASAVCYVLYKAAVVNLALY